MNYDEKIQAILRNRGLLDENIANLEKDIERINYDLEVKKQQIIWPVNNYLNNLKQLQNEAFSGYIMNYLCFMFYGVQLFVFIDKDKLFNEYPAIWDMIYYITTKDTIVHDLFLELELALKQCEIKYYYKSTNGENNVSYNNFNEAFCNQRKINLEFLQNEFFKKGKK